VRVDFSVLFFMLLLYIISNRFVKLYQHIGEPIKVSIN
jgi:hypothetical protein